MRAPIDGWQRGWIVLGALAQVGCVSWRVQEVAPIVLVTETTPGTVRLERTDASRVVLTRPMVVGDSIRGQQGAVAVADIKALAVRRFDAARTLGLAGGILAAAAVGIAVWANSFEIPNLYGARRIP
jgi:hypothetical protein